MTDFEMTVAVLQTHQKHVKDLEAKIAVLQGTANRLKREISGQWAVLMAIVGIFGIVVVIAEYTKFFVR